MEKARNFRNYKVWQDAVEYCSMIYQQTDKMPWFEKKGLCDQLQRAAVSISSNIAELTHEVSAEPSLLELCLTRRRWAIANVLQSLPMQISLVFSTLPWAVPTKLKLSS